MSFDTNPKTRKPGICKGKIEMSKDFDEPLSFYGLDGIAYHRLPIERKAEA